MSRRHLHLDPFCGAAGDMFLGLLHALGVPADVLESVPARLLLDGVTVACSTVQRGGLAAGRVIVRVHGAVEPPAEPAGGALASGPWPPAEHHHGLTGAGRHLADVRALIARADLPPRAKELSERACELLFAAEARVHGVPLADTQQPAGVTS